MISVKAQQKVFLSKLIKKGIEEKVGNESEVKQVDIILIAYKDMTIFYPPQQNTKS